MVTITKTKRGYMLTQSIDATFKDNIDAQGNIKDIKKLITIVTEITQFVTLEGTDEKGNKIQKPELLILLGGVMPNDTGYGAPLRFFANEDLVFLGLSDDRIEEDGEEDDLDEASDDEDEYEDDEALI